MRTVKHPILLKDPDVLQFLESSEVNKKNYTFCLEMLDSSASVSAGRTSDKPQQTCSLSSHPCASTFPYWTDVVLTAALPAAQCLLNVAVGTSLHHYLETASTLHCRKSTQPANLESDLSVLFLEFNFYFNAKNWVKTLSSTFSYNMPFVCGETFESGELKNLFISPHKCLSIYFPDKQEMVFHALKTASTSTLNLNWEKTFSAANSMSSWSWVSISSA